MFARLRLAERITLSLLAVSIIYATLGLVSVIWMRQIDHTFTDLNASLTEPLAHVGEMRAAFDEAAVAAGDSSEGTDSLAALSKTWQREAKAAKSGLTDPGAKAAVDRILSDLGDYLATAQARLAPGAGESDELVNAERSLTREFAAFSRAQAAASGKISRKGTKDS